MSVAVAMILFGAMLVYGGWKNLSIAALLKGDNATVKPVATGTPAASSSGTSSTPSQLAPLPSTAVAGGRF